MGTKRAHLCRRSADLFWTERVSRSAEERGHRTPLLNEL